MFINIQIKLDNADIFSSKYHFYPPGFLDAKCFISYSRITL